MLKPTFGLFMAIRYGLRQQNRKIFRSIRPPYVLLPNHVSYWDPVFIGFFVPAPVYFVTSDRQFRGKLWGSILRFVGAIPKSKAISDFETVKSIFEVTKRGGVIGIFPEGRRNWDGHSLPPLYATAKLIRALKLPVIVPTLKGAFLSRPRWSQVRRKGRVTLEFRLGFTPEELKSMGTGEIYQKIEELLEYDEYQYQRESMIRFRSRNKAQGMDLVLFTCQSCEEIGTISSHRSELRCGNCGYTVEIDGFGFFMPPSRFETIRDWNLWQLDLLREKLSRGPDRGSDPLLSDGPVWLYRGFKRDTMVRVALGTLVLESNRAVFASANERFEFGLDGVSGINVQTHEEMEFYHEESLYHFQFVEAVSGYKWMMAINMLKGVDIFAVDPAAI